MRLAQGAMIVCMEKQITPNFMIEFYPHSDIAANCDLRQVKISRNYRRDDGANVELDRMQ
jgi:hypothetical protein